MSRVYNEDATTYALGGLLSRQQITRSSEYRITRARYFNLSKQDMRKRIWSYAEQLVDEKGYVSPVDLPMDRLTKKQLEDWRFRRIPYLEQVTEDDLNKVEFIVNELREFGKSAKLKSSQTVYVSWGKGCCSFTPICSKQIRDRQRKAPSRAGRFTRE